MWILPTRRRPADLKRFIEAAVEYGISTPGLILVNKDELEELKAEYNKIILPSNWKFVGIDAFGVGNTMRAAWPLYKDEPWVGVVSDDHVPLTPKWDQLLVGSVKGWNIVSSNDGWQTTGDINTSRMHGAAVFSGDLIRAWGYLFPEGFNHMYFDDVWETIGRKTNCWHLRTDIVVKHLNRLKADLNLPIDDTHRFTNSAENYAHDEKAFKAWLETDLQKCLDAVKDLQKKSGAVSKPLPDMTKVKLLIATPCGSGKVEYQYLNSFQQTVMALRQAGAEVWNVIEAYNSDLPGARASLLAVFYRSNCTHMLMIDDDMGWDANAVLRLFVADKDFVAVAGRKKRVDNVYGISHFDDDLKMLPISFDQESLTTQVREVGGAFVLLTRACVEKMVNGYPELEFQTISGESAWALFDPMLIPNSTGTKKTRRPEDFSFCRRWEALGGKVYVCPDVSLKHVGSNTWEGAWIETWKMVKPNVA